MVLQLAATPSRAAALGSTAVDRIYMGSELCPGRLPALSELRKSIGAQTPLTLVTPPVAGAAFEHVGKLLEEVARPEQPCEVVVNDFGVLELAADCPGVTPVMGRLISRNFVELSGEKFSLASRESVDFLRRHYRVSRFEVTNFKRPIEFSEVAEWAGIPLSLHYPYMPLTISRACTFRFADAAQDSTFASVLCSRPCRTQSFRLGYPDQVKDDLYLRGNTVFIRYPTLPYTGEDLARLGIDRIVFGEGPHLIEHSDIEAIRQLQSG